MNTILNYLQFYFIGLAAIVVFFSIGRILTRRYFNSTVPSYTSIFASIITGMIVLVTLVSVVMTGFKTINTGFILLSILLFIELRRTREIRAIQYTPFLPSTKQILTIALAFLLFYSIEAFQLLKTGSFSYILPHPDFIFSGNIADALISAKVENFYMEGNLYNPKYRFMMPYHYFEIWMAGLVSMLSGKASVLCLMLVVFPAFYLTAWTGMLALFEHFKVLIRTRELFYSFLLLFAGGIFLPQYSKISLLSVADVLSPVPMEMAVKKYAVFYIFIIASLLAILKGRTGVGLLILLSLSFVSITAFPAILAGMGLWMVIAFFKKLESRAVLGRMVLYTAAVSVLIIVIYFLLNKSPFGLGIVEKDQIMGGSSLFSKAYIKTMINIIGGSAIQMGVLFLPLLIPAFLLFRRIWTEKRFPVIRTPFLLFLSIIIAGLFSWALLWQMPNSAGFFATSINYLNILLVLVFIFSLTTESKSRGLLLTLFLLVAGTRMVLALWANNDLRNKQLNLHSDEYLAAVSAEYSKKPVGGVYIMGESSYHNAFDKNTFFRRLGNYLKFQPGRTFTTNISIFNSPISADPLERKLEYGIITLGVFYQFVDDQKLKGEYVSVERSQLDFIDRYNLGYVIADSNATIPPLILERASQIFKDSVSGEQFVFLKRKNQR